MPAADSGKIIVRGAREHNLAKYQRRAAPRQDDRVHRPVGFRQEQPGLRHHLCRGPTPLCREPQRVRPPVPRPDGQARCRHDRRVVAGHLHRPEVGQPQPSFHGRHDHRDLRLPAPAVRAHRRAALPQRRHPAAAPDAAADRRSHPQVARRHALPGASPRSCAAARATTTRCWKTSPARATCGPGSMARSSTSPSS